MSLEIIIQQITAVGYLIPGLSDKQQQGEEQEILEKRRFRLSFGDKTYISKDLGFFKSRTQLLFIEPYSFFYDNHARLLNIQIFKEHQFGENNDFKHQLNARVDLSDFNIIKGDYIETDLTDLYGSSLGTLTLAVDVFKKGPLYYEKVISSVLFEAVREEVQRAKKEIKVSAAGKNIKNLIVNNQLSNTLMTISSMHMIPETQDPEIFNKECFLMLKYGTSIKVYTKLLKSTVKDSTSFLDYLQFVKNQDFKFEFFFFFIDELGNYLCKARGQIKYIVFDETITAHSIIMFDKRSSRYGNLMIKFAEKEVEESPNIIYKTQKKIRENQVPITDAIDQFNRYKFQAKYNNAVLSDKLRELEIQKMKQEEEKNRPLNPEEKKKQEEHKKFISFLQKEVLRIQRQLQKRQQKTKVQERKEKYLPSVQAGKQRYSKNKSDVVNKSMTGTGSVSEFREKKVTFPKV